MKKKTVILLSICVVLLLAVVALGAEQYYRLFVKNIVSRDAQSHWLYVYPDTDIDSVLLSLEQDYEVSSPLSLRLHRRLLRWNTAHTGAYLLEPQMGDLALIRRLRSGEQTPVKVSFNNIRTREQLSARLGQQLLIDSIDIISRLEDNDYMARYGLKKETAVALFLPNSYEMYWNISADHFFEKMAQAYNKWWTKERQAKADALHLKRYEVTTIASIIEEETNKEFEKPIIAGLYLNRLEKGMRLQSCPTVKFALQDFSLRRILNVHLEYDSPYNTYLYAGLPPGPIRIPTTKTMDAVLNHEKNNYLYMCANADFSHTHRFSSTYAEHARYAREYQAALNKRGIK